MCDVCLPSERRESLFRKIIHCQIYFQQETLNTTEPTFCCGFFLKKEIAFIASWLPVNGFNKHCGLEFLPLSCISLGRCESLEW